MSNVFRHFAAEVQKVISQLVAAGALPAAASDVRLTVEPPRDAKHGDWTTNAAMVLSKPAGKPPRALAELMLPKLQALPQVVKAEIAGPGFINVTMDVAFWQAQVAAILQAGTAYGTSDIGAGVSANIEYVSANPTGPMHIGHLRNACFGDALANLMAKAGYKLTREFYTNDAGNQMDILARSVHLRYRETFGESITIPEGMYPGEYVKDCAEALKARDGDKWLKLLEAEWLEPIKHCSGAFFLEEIKSDLSLIGVVMDRYSSEKALRDSGAVEKCIALLEGRGLVYRGVLEPPKGKLIDEWEPKEQTLFRSTQFGDDVDRPLVKADGNYTYFAPDVAYHLDKYQRSGPVMVTVVGDGHAGWVKRIRAAVAAVSEGKAQFSVKMYALVKILENGQPVRMSKRAGNFVTLRDAVDKVGKDVLRFVMLLRAPEQILEFDFANVVEQSKENPVFYVQYAHARCRSVLRKAFEAMPGVNEGKLANANLALLQDPAEVEVIKVLSQFPRIIEAAALAQEPHRIAYFVQEVAAAFHGLWNKGTENATLRFVHEDQPELTLARLALVAAVAQVIALNLQVMGVDPVEEMR